MSIHENVPTNLATQFDCKQGAVRAVRFNVDGNYCLTCGSDKTLKLWNPHHPCGLLLKTYSGHGYEVLDACASCDNALIASCGMDKNIFIWDVTTGKSVRKFRGHVVAMNDDATVVFSASLDSTVRAWDLKSRSFDPLQIMNEAQDSVTSLAITDHEILTGSADNRIRRYDLRTGQMLTDFMGGTVTCVNFTQDNQCTLVSSLDSTVRLLDKDSGELLADFTGHKNDEYKIDSCLNSTDTAVFSGSEDGHVYCWDLIESKLLCKLAHPVKRVVHSISAHPKLSILLSACMSSVYVWKAANMSTDI